MKKPLILAALIALAVPAVASEGDDPTSLSYISYLERFATVQPSTQQDSVEAVINMPLVAGDRVDTARETRMEVILADGNIVWLDEYSTLSLDAVAFSRDNDSDRSVLYLAEGTIMVEISEHRLNGEALRVDGRAATVYLSDTGLYRILALPSGGLRLEVWQGLAEAATVAGGILIQAESAAEIRDGEVTDTEPHLTWSDDFASWVEQRRQVLSGESSQYVDARYERQAAQLDNYGNWVYVQEYNTWAWQPTVSSGWRPYTAGRWYWTPTGWSWVSYEPWGWLPYHYGNWYLSASVGWVWGWGSCWGPAWVNWGWGPGWVGWCPSGYYWGWYWPRYSQYYGYPGYPYQPGHPGYPGGGGGQTPRRDVIPRPGAGGGSGADSGAVRRASLPRPDDSALGLKGRSKIAEMDRSAWNVVSDRDFASPNLSRLVKRGDEALRGRNDTAVISSDPLRTAPPSVERPANELERVFRGVERSTDRDLTRIMARDDSLRPEDALRLVQPTTTSDISRRSAPASDTSQARTTWDVSGSRRAEPTLSTRSGSPLRASEDRSATSSYSSTPDQPAGSTRIQGAPRSNPFVPRTRPSTAVAPRSSTSGTTGGSTETSRSGSVYRAPTNRSAPPTGTTTRPAPTTRSGASTSRPIIVPRTAPTAPRRSTGSTRAPSRNPTASASRPSSSRKSSAGSSSSRPSSSGRSSSAGRSSGGSSAPRSAPSSSARSSGGARRN